MHPELCRFVPIGLPFGPKPRLILAHLNAEALRQQSPEIEIEASLTAFVRRARLAGGRRRGAPLPGRPEHLGGGRARLGGRLLRRARAARGRGGQARPSTGWTRHIRSAGICQLDFGCRGIQVGIQL
jgi:hypothetical protein